MHLSTRISKRSLFGSTAALALLLAGCSSTVAIDLKTGDCLDLPEDANLEAGFEMTSVKTVDCSESHDAQVIGEKELEDGDYPGVASIQKIAYEFCVPEFENFTGVPLSQSTLDVFPLVPTEESWDKADDRTLVCIAANTSKQVTDTFEDQTDK